MGFRYC